MCLTVSRNLTITSVVRCNPIVQVNPKGALSVKLPTTSDTNSINLIISDEEMIEACLKYLYKGEIRNGVNEGVFVTSSEYPVFSGYKAGGDKAKVSINMYVNSITFHISGKVQKEFTMNPSQEVNYPIKYGLYKHIILFFNDNKKVAAYNITKGQVVKLMKTLHEGLFPEVPWEEVEWPDVDRSETVEEVIERQKASLGDAMRTLLLRGGSISAVFAHRLLPSGSDPHNFMETKK